MARTRISGAGFLLAVLLAAAISFSALMCLKEAFSLGGSVLTLLAICGAAAVLSACGMLPRRRWLAGLTALFLWLGLAVWQCQSLRVAIEGLLYAVTTEYAAVYDGVTVMGQAGDCLLFLSFLAVPMAWVTAWTVCREGNILFLLLACLPIWLLCLMIVDLAPVLWLVVLTAALLLLVLTHGVREHSAREGSRLGWWLLLPTVILVMAVTVIWPPADYQPSGWSERLRSGLAEGTSLESVQERALELVTPQRSSWTRALRQVELASLGPRTMNGKKVLESQSVQGSYYLRGLSLGVYKDNCWQAVDQSDYAAGEFADQPLLAVEGDGSSLSLRVRTEQAEKLLYTTYVLSEVPVESAFVDDSWVENTQELLEYRIDYFASGSGSGSVPAGYDAYVNEVYTQLPQSLRLELENFMQEMGWDLSDSPEKLAEHVKNLAEYDLNTPKLPGGEEFVTYFLRESRRGYCVHFATATAALLRAMGIPSRYVTGYAVSGTAGEWVTVTEDDAHAWVEYYVNGVGWLPLEATPAAAFTQTEETIAQTPDPPEEPVQNQTEPDLPEYRQETAFSAAPAETQQQAAASGLWWLLGGVVAAVVLVLLRYLAARQRRAERCSRGTPNRRAMAYWRWLVLLARQEGTVIEEELICLAEKARFSQHTMTEEEIGQLHQAVESRIDRLKQYPAGKQLWFRLGKVLY